MSDAALLERSPFAGLRELWESKRGGDGLQMPTRILLDTLGLGLEQVYRALSSFASYADFEEWACDVAGAPEAARWARYQAWRDGAEPPDDVRAQLAAIDAMPPVLDARDLAQWDADGYVVLRQAITPEEAAAAAAVLWESQGADPADPSSWHADRAQGIFVLLFQHPVLEPARRSARVHKAFAQLWGTPDLWMICDRMSFNPPLRPRDSFRAPRLHWDVSLALPIPFATQGILYLTDTAADQGALELVPGFHRGIADWLAGLGEADPRTVDLGDRAITVPAGAGDLVIWRHDLPHGASPNHSDRPRLAQYINMYSPALETNPVWR